LIQTAATRRARVRSIDVVSAIDGEIKQGKRERKKEKKERKLSERERSGAR